MTRVLAERVRQLFDWIARLWPRRPRPEAGVREPRRPRPALPAAAVALAEPRTVRRVKLSGFFRRRGE
jgi:hypothetical protein